MTHTLQPSAGRDRAIDVAKGLGMLLVLFAHTNYHEPLLTVIYSFHMPLFFVISGMLFSDARYPTFRGFVLRKAKTLLVPFLIYAGVTLAFTCVVDLRDGVDQTYFLNMLKTAGRSLIARNSDDFKYNAPLWFVPCLFLVECLYYGVNKIKNKPLFVAAVAALCAGGWALEMFDIGRRYYVWNVPSALFSLVFFAMGHRVLGSVRTGLVKKGFGKPRFALVAAAGIALTIPLALLNGKVSLGSNIVGVAPLLVLTGLFGSVFVLAVSQLFTSGLIEYIGRNSFDFMAIHVLTRTAVTFAMTTFLSVDFWDVSTEYRYTLPVFAVVLVGTYAIVFVKNAVARKWAERKKH